MLSIDVGSKKVCVVDGIYRNNVVTVTSWGEAEFTNEVTVNGMINDRATLTFLINEIVKSRQMKSKEAVVTIDSTDIIVREFKIPNVKPQIMQQLVGNEMQKVIGADNNYLIDYIVVGGIDVSGMASIKAFAVKKDVVESYHTLLKGMKIKPFAFDIHANAISKLLSNTPINGMPPSNGNVIVTDIGYTKITFSVFSGGICTFNRTELSPVMDLVRDLSGNGKEEITEKNMREIDLTHDYELENPELANTYKFFVSRLSDEIQRYAQYVIMNSPTSSVDKIYICGGVSGIVGLDSELSKSLRLPVEVIKEVGRLHVPNGCNISKICNAAGALIRL